jgi:hypothetical protein
VSQIRALHQVLQKQVSGLLYHLPAGTPREDPEWWARVACPCDLGTIAYRVDSRQYGTPMAYLADVALIVQVRHSMIR